MYTHIAKRRDPDSFKCKPFRLKYLQMIFLLSTMSIVADGWSVVVDGLLIDLPWALPFHYLNAALFTLQSGNFSCISDLKFRSFFDISLDVEWYASFVPAWTIMWLSFSWCSGMIWWFESSTVAPGKFLTLIFRSPPHNPSSKTPMMIESATINVVFFGHCPFTVIMFSLAVLLCRLFLDR